MPTVACPSCGERGKIPPTLIGARIKCKKCGLSFNVAAPTAKSTVTAGVSSDVAIAEPSSPTHSGIAVEGLDSSAWSLPSDQSSDMLKTTSESSPQQVEGTEGTSNFIAQENRGCKEYKVLSSRDKIFEGKFDLNRLEEALNYYARDGWVVKAMSTPHVKAFTEGTKEEIVILLER